VTIGTQPTLHLVAISAIEVEISVITHASLVIAAQHQSLNADVSVARTAPACLAGSINEAN
jgi:hypothetical protein